MAALHRYGVMPLPPYIRRPDGASRQGRRRLPDRLRRAARAPSPLPRPGCTSRRICWRALEARGIRRVPVTLHVGRRHLPAGQGRRHPRTTACMRNGARSRRETARAIAETRAAGGQDRRGRHHRRCACWKRRRRTMARVAPFSGDTDIFITARLPLPGRGPAADQLPPAALHPVHAGLGLRRHGAHARRLCPCHIARATASIPMATLPADRESGGMTATGLGFDVHATDGAARRGR